MRPQPAEQAHAALVLGIVGVGQPTAGGEQGVWTMVRDNPTNRKNMNPEVQRGGYSEQTPPFNPDEDATVEEEEHGPKEEAVPTHRATMGDVSPTTSDVKTKVPGENPIEAVSGTIPGPRDER